MNTCAIGDKYARNEVTHPERTVTSTAVILGGDKPRVSVKTASNIPKDKITIIIFAGLVLSVAGLIISNDLWFKKKLKDN